MTSIESPEAIGAHASVFAPSANERKALSVQQLLRLGFLAVTLLLLIPAAAILGVGDVQGLMDVGHEMHQPAQRLGPVVAGFPPVFQDGVEML